MATLVDSSVLLDVLTEDPQWFDWSSNALAQASDAEQVLINPVIYAEVSTRFGRIEDLDEALMDFERADLPWDAAFVAAKAFVSYRRRGGVRSSTLPDFFIGAHAAVDHLTLITRDASRYRTYFPTVRVLSPD